MDLLTTELNRLLRNATGNTLWLVDENIQLDVPANPSVQVVGNRLDVIERLQQRGWQARFSDFDLSACADEHFDLILYRVSKEKPVVHFLINEARRLLCPDGSLVLLGDKGEGIRTYARKAESCLGGVRREQKLGKESWLAEIGAGSKAGECPDHQRYTELRPVCEDAQHEYWSKPGLFGWNKIDRGSALLIEHLPSMLNAPIPFDGSVLDLGCGFGYLALNVTNNNTRLVCSDNNAAALTACRYNLDKAGLEQAEVIASNAGDRLTSGFDLIVCNPPFHSGFSVDGDLTDRFLHAAQRLLSANGTACFVVNQHIPLERKAGDLFTDIHTHLDTGQFKLVRLRKPINPQSQGCS
ncbi:methyltransferase [Marinobacterium sediminicola]|uniref:16S rRNA (Guanine1207-N2)-methyltransferase n=1 Tax=Marinobacterium sediminicola TaxID=518898 RepID=A0ABY1S402_9GAMM|nr:methyltransferase [Marinobacterium sediminicola]ULG68905.1 methyltransferase [Marinobacterium sediminicola]SMR77893.1 16S rRNA (guanine1207-N2)-methyltransferase [Marinobacterium sediminicola]